MRNLYDFDYFYWRENNMTSTTLKLLALVLMLIDHIAEFIPGTPIWFHWLGRISAPLFMFCMAWGLYYTHDRKKYLIRMYCFGVLMALIDVICNNIIKDPYCSITNNIFVTLLLIGIISSLIELKKQDRKKGTKYIIIFGVYQIITTFLCAIAQAVIPGNGIIEFVGAITANLIFCEGSFIFVFLGVLIYFNRENKSKLSFVYCAFCLFFLLLSAVGDFSIKSLFLENYQWMMIASLPFMFIYSGKKGRGLKYLFYIFYPVHIIILFWIGNLFF
jgi:hypothetical protein